jgi:hypothetical protein
VTVRLTQFGRTLLARRLGGVQARMRARAATSGGARTATARTRAILRVERFTTPAGSWAPGRAGLTERGRRFVRSLRGKLIAVASLRCDGHDANLRGSAVVSSRLSVERARVMCDALGRLGVRGRARGWSATARRSRSCPTPPPQAAPATAGSRSLSHTGPGAASVPAEPAYPRSGTRRTVSRTARISLKLADDQLDLRAAAEAAVEFRRGRAARAREAPRAGWPRGEGAFERRWRRSA